MLGIRSGKEMKVDGGYTVRLNTERDLITVFDSNASKVHEISPPENSAFYFLTMDPRDGPCVIVSFDPDHQRKGRMDWRHRIDLKTGGLTLICPFV